MGKLVLWCLKSLWAPGALRGAEWDDYSEDSCLDAIRFTADAGSILLIQRPLTKSASKAGAANEQELRDIVVILAVKNDINITW